MYGSVLVVMVDSGSFALGGVHAIEGVGMRQDGGVVGVPMGRLRANRVAMMRVPCGHTGIIQQPEQTSSANRSFNRHGGAASM
jgi:hypothetical protein